MQIYEYLTHTCTHSLCNTEISNHKCKNTCHVHVHNIIILRKNSEYSTHTHTHTRTHTHTCRHTCTHTHKQTHVDTHTHTQTHMYTHTQTHVHTHRDTHAYTHTHAQAHTHTHILEVVYGLCLSKPCTPRDGSNHAVIIHLLSSCPQLHHAREVNYSSSRMDRTDTTTDGVRSTTMVTTATSGSWIM